MRPELETAVLLVDVDEEPVALGVLEEAVADVLVATPGNNDGAENVDRVGPQHMLELRGVEVRVVDHLG